tara:strand:+ start:651 stop:794 length:144 start_codon:yes stop_codon:yes gene_type:complete
MVNFTECNDSLLTEVVGDDRNDGKRKVIITEEDEWIRQQNTGGGAET